MTEAPNDRHPQQVIAELQRKLDERTAELEESIAQQTATSEVLKVISRSTFGLSNVLDTLVSSAARLCGTMSTIYLLRDGLLHLEAGYNISAEWIAYRRSHPTVPSRDTPSGRAALTGQIDHVPDLLVDPEFKHAFLVKLGDYRATLNVPLVRDGLTIGVLSLGRPTPGPFAPRQIELAKTFADQAVIAIENVRLFNETQQSLGRQAATTEILEVVNSSPGNLTPVFDAILEKATLLSNSAFGALAIHNGDDMHQIVAMRGMPAEFPDFLRGPVRLGPETGLGRLVRGESFVHIIDAADDEAYRLGNPVRRALVDIAGARSYLAVPIAKDGILLGSFTIYRREVRPFEGDLIALLQNFATQAAIAIQNARLFNETREALERQTATADILKVIAGSPDDVQPVFEAIAERSNRIVDARSTAVYSLVDGVLHLMAFTPTSPEADATLRALFPQPLSQVSWGEPISRGEIGQITDMYDPSVPPRGRTLAERRGFRSLMVVPLVSEQKTIGVISVTRVSPGKFADHHVQLLQTFADQAVIAIENVRLFDEVQAKTRDLSEALTYQTGSANILSVIASSPTNVGPVLQAIVESACELCGAYDAVVVLRDEVGLLPAAHHGPIPLNRARWANDRTTISGRAMIDRLPVHVLDVASAEGAELATAQAMSRVDGGRTVLGVPMLREGESIGAIVLRRTEVHAFGEKQINLLQTFADQAVIAIGNVRLFEEVQARTRELTESLQQQTATSDVLQVISSSPGDLAPVFERMLVNATRVCGAEFGSLLLTENGSIRVAAQCNVPAEFAIARGNRILAPHPNSPLALSIRTKQVVHEADLRTTEPYLERHPGMLELVELGGVRTIAIVPMLRDEEVIGAISVYRNEVQLFSDKQIELLSNFAKQAVIAIENARLLSELRQRTSDLSKSLDDLRTAQDRLVQTEKLASLGQLTAGIAHEIKNPLNFVNNFSALTAELTDELNDLLKPAPLDDKMRGEADELTGIIKDNLRKVVQHGKRADSIVKNMLLHSREGSREHRHADINSLLDESLNLAYHGARAEKGEFNITLERDFDADAGTIELFPQEITRAFLNVIANGVYAATKRKNENKEPDFEPTLRATTKNLGTTVEIRIRDNGTGIPADVQEKMFNPFFTTKPAGEGTGLGLSMTHDIIVKQHGGRIDVATEPGQFTEFTIVLPRKSVVLDRERGET